MGMPGPIEILIVLAVGGICVGVVALIVVAATTGSKRTHPNLLPCPQCGHGVSPAATTCPNCGHPLQPEKP